MLQSISIRDVVLIDKLNLQFKEGLCVFTGETGAGKSILLDALSLALGARADTNLIRHGQDSLSVVAEFSIPDSHPVLNILKENDLDLDTTLILRRTVAKDGKSKCYINDTPISVNLMRQIGDLLVEIHGQFASHSLLNPATHLSVLDKYGKLEEKAQECQNAYYDWQNAIKQVARAEDIVQKAKEDEEFLTHAVKELEAFNPAVGEEEELANKRTSLMNAEKITESLNTAYQILSQDGSLQSQISTAMRELEKASRFIPNRFDGILADLDSVSEGLAVATDELENIASAFEDPTQELERVDERFFALKDLARKYHVECDELPATLSEFRSKLSLIDKGTDELLLLKQAEDTARIRFVELAKSLSDLRHKAGSALDKAVCAELPALKLEKAKFITQIADLETQQATPDGLNKVQFCISTNAAPAAPLNKIASGGELARFMLALKVNLANLDDVPTLVFDEVDSGIGGATASAVGERLARLGQIRQVLVVTHSPQVAAFGAHHMKVLKNAQDEKVLTTVLPLDEKERKEEIARMLSGAQITDEARRAAETLLEKSCLTT
ncbi:MAG: DNA repair protein RecN [Alphaproteobacteria bacterium]